MSALRSAGLRLRTAAMKLPKWLPPGPRLPSGSTLGRGSGLFLAGGENLAAGAPPRLEVQDVIHAALGPGEVLARRAADLEDELGLAVVEERDLRVGGLALVGARE